MCQPRPLYCSPVQSVMSQLIYMQQPGLGFIQSGVRESGALPCSPLCVAELTHSSPGPTLPQSSTASLRTLVYDSAA